MKSEPWPPTAPMHTALTCCPECFQAHSELLVHAETSPEGVVGPWVTCPVTGRVVGVVLSFKVAA